MNTVDAAWRELELDALASDGPIAESPVGSLDVERDLLRQWRDASLNDDASTLGDLTEATTALLGDEG